MHCLEMYSGRLMIWIILSLGFERGPLSEERVDGFMQEMKKKYEYVIDDTKRKRVRIIISQNSDWCSL